MASNSYTSTEGWERRQCELSHVDHEGIRINKNRGSARTPG